MEIDWNTWEKNKRIGCPKCSERGNIDDYSPDWNLDNSVLYLAWRCNNCEFAWVEKYRYWESEEES